MGSIFKEVKETPFNSIEGYDDLKNIINRVLSSEESFNLLLIGPSASSKTQFLIEIMKAYKCEYFDGTNTTSRILDILEEKRPKIILLDEAEKMSHRGMTHNINIAYKKS